MRSDWKISTLNDVCTLITDGAHNSPQSVSTGMYMASVKDFTEYGFDFSNCRKIALDDYKKLKKQGCVPLINDILVGKDGARYFEDVIIYRQVEEPVLLSSIAILRVDTTVMVPEFLYYVLKTPEVKRNVRDNYGSGSAIPRIVLKDFRRMPITYPSIEKQKRIVSVCSSIDEKIQTNVKINENLLQQARALFHQWVTDTKSAMSKLSDVADINPETYSLKDNWSFVNYLDTSSITAGTITEVQYILPSEEKLPSRARRILRKGDIVFSTVRPNQLHYGIIANPMPNMLGSTGFAVIRSKYAAIPNEIVYLALTETSFVEQMQQLAEQSVSTFPSIRPADLDACILPELKAEDDDFIEAIKAIFHTVAANDEEKQRLAALRDTLLPRLLSGELDVSGIEF